MTEQPEQKRRRRRRRRRGGGGGSAPDVAQSHAPDAPPEWRWRTFPVLAAFAAGAFVIAFLIGAMPDLFPIFFAVALFGIAFCFAHFLSRMFVTYRRRG